MPWFPDFVNAVELARVETRTAGRADPAGLYFEALEAGDTHDLETVWPGQVVVHDPRAGEVRGHRQLSRFVRRNQAWLKGLHARTETVASTSVQGRAVVEILAYLSTEAGELVWPVAVVAESPDEESVVFRSYCSQWPVAERREIRPAILRAAPARPADVVGRYFAALEAGDASAAVDVFAADAYLREPIGATATHRGRAELSSFFTRQLSAGGIGLEYCAVTDDGVRCAVEYTCLQWGGRDLPPQAGLGVYERDPEGRLTAARLYDDIEPPVGLLRDMSARTT
jgi:limonene-1,2-epoxide hydrolase